MRGTENCEALDRGRVREEVLPADRERKRERERLTRQKEHGERKGLPEKEGSDAEERRREKEKTPKSTRYEIFLDADERTRG